MGARKEIRPLKFVLVKPVQNQFHFLKFENFSEALEAIFKKILDPHSFGLNTMFLGERIFLEYFFRKGCSNEHGKGIQITLHTNPSVAYITVPCNENCRFYIYYLNLDANSAAVGCEFDPPIARMQLKKFSNPSFDKKFTHSRFTDL